MPRAKQCGADLSVHRRQLLIFFPVLKDTAREKASPLQYPCKTRNDQPKHAQEGSRSQINRWLSPILCFSSFLPRASFRFLSENVLPAEQEVRGASRRGGGWVTQDDPLTALHLLTKMALLAGHAQELAGHAYTAKAQIAALHMQVHSWSAVEGGRILYGRSRRFLYLGELV